MSNIWEKIASWFDEVWDALSALFTDELQKALADVGPVVALAVKEVATGELEVVFADDATAREKGTAMRDAAVDRAAAILKIEGKEHALSVLNLATEIAVQQLKQELASDEDGLSGAA